MLLIGTPLAWWLARSRGPARAVVAALVALPLVMPPTVIGFYLLVLLGPEGPIGSAWEAIGGARIVFSFPGLVIGSIVFSLPFVVQPLENAFRQVPRDALEAASTLGASPFDRFVNVVLPLSRGGYLVAIVLGFAHTVGEFGVVLMIGGSIPGETEVLSISLFRHVEALRWDEAHAISAGLLGFSFLALLLVQFARRGEAR